MSVRIIPRRHPPLFTADGQGPTLADWLWDRFAEDEQDKLDLRELPAALEQRIDRLPQP